jgi:hypothetical protein
VKHAIEAVTPTLSVLLPDAIDPAAVKTAPARGELARLEARWSKAKTDKERAAIARDAELLADRVEEDLPGAPQSRRRTDLYPGEVPSATPATSFLGELASTLGLPGNETPKTNWGRVALLGLAAVGTLGIVSAVVRR